MSTFFVAKEWRGRLNVASMRAFPDEAGVIAYLKQIEKNTTSTIPQYVSEGGNVTSGSVRVYELSPVGPPVNRTGEFREMVVGKQGGG